MAGRSPSCRTGGMEAGSTYRKSSRSQDQTSSVGQRCLMHGGRAGTSWGRSDKVKVGYLDRKAPPPTLRQQRIWLRVLWAGTPSSFGLSPVLLPGDLCIGWSRQPTVVAGRDSQPFLKGSDHGVLR